jgi:hypothetical protein
MKNSSFRKSLRRKAARIRQGFRDKRTPEQQSILIAKRRGESKKELRKLTKLMELKRLTKEIKTERKSSED